MSLTRVTCGSRSVMKRVRNIEEGYIPMTTINRNEKVTQRVPNRTYAENDKAFIAACKRANVNPTKRQASKYRRKIGLAYREGRTS